MIDTGKLIEQEMLTGDLRVTLDDINYKPVDMVEVVRCKDCVNFKKVRVGYEEFYDCHLLRINCHSENDFCSRGERRDDD